MAKKTAPVKTKSQTKAAIKKVAAKPVVKTPAKPKPEKASKPKLEKVDKAVKVEAAKAAKVAKKAADKVARAEAAAVKVASEEAAKWMDYKNKFGDKKVSQYSMTSVYEAQTPINHKVLGWGFIVSVQNDRLEVVFEQGTKILISNYKPN